MASVSVVELRKRIDEKGVSTLLLERQAGLKRNVIQNILQGKSEMPRWKTIEAICKALKCLPADILVDYEPADNKNSQKESEIINRDLFLFCCQSVTDVLDMLDIDISFKEYISTIISVYEYSVENGLGNNVDEKFCNWVVKKNFGSN